MLTLTGRVSDPDYHVSHRSLSPSEIPLPSSPPKSKSTAKLTGSGKYALKFKGDDSKKKYKKSKAEPEVAEEPAAGGGGGGKESLSVEETNKIRTSLGMARVRPRVRQSIRHKFGTTAFAYYMLTGRMPHRTQAIAMKCP